MHIGVLAGYLAARGCFGLIRARTYGSVREHIGVLAGYLAARGCFGLIRARTYGSVREKSFPQQ